MTKVLVKANRVIALCSGLTLTCLMLLSTLGCDVVGEMAFSLVEEIEERNAEAAQARMDLVPRPPTARSSMENSAVQLANDALAGNKSKVKEAFCGSPPDLSHLPPQFFKFEPSAYIPEDTPEECRAAADRLFPDLESCYLVFDNGSTAYVSCYHSPDSTETIECMSVKKLLWEILWNEELRKDCNEQE